MLEIPLSLLLLSPSLPPARGEDEPPPPDPALVEAAAGRLASAYAAGEESEIVAALRAARAVVAPPVIDEVAKGLKRKSEAVRDGALAALRWMDHPSAVDALHDAYLRNRAFATDDAAMAALLKAIGQHGDPRSLKVLTDHPFQPTDFRAVQARILGLGRIRTNAALEATVEMMNKAGGVRRGGDQRLLGEFRLTLVVLTGTDQGPRHDDWIAWWNEHKRTFEVATELPDVPRELRRRWFEYWEIPDPRAPRRGDREGRGGGERGGGGDADGG
ncbi:MAG: HEAT repeat domain-containing protein [Planctomycetota bacterium]